MQAPRVYHSEFQDSRRWQGFPFREGDILIATPPKCGTTWTQMMCALLIFQTPKPPQLLSKLSPWLDMLTRDRDDVVAELERQRHRRFIKSHTPLDGLPMDERVTYICVGRDPRDVAVSMDHHRNNMDRATLDARRAAVAGTDDIAAHRALNPGPQAATLEGRFWEWMQSDAPPERTTSNLRGTLRHFECALAARERPNVIVLHYADLKADLEGEMRRLATQLGIEVPETTWPSLVRAASFEAMRAQSDRLIPEGRDGVFKNSKAFFHSGQGGHWRSFFDVAAEQRYRALIGKLTTDEVDGWAHRGRTHSVDERP